MWGLPQISMMMILGMFPFGLKTVPYQQFQRQMNWRHPTNSRIGKRPSAQFLGRGDDIITLSGCLYPAITGGKISLAVIKAMADAGKAWPLIEGTGIYYGLFVIESLNETHSAFFPDGAPRKIEFTLQLKRTDDDPNLLGQLAGGLLSMLDLK